MLMNDGLNPVQRAMAHSLSVVGKDERFTADEAKPLAELLLFPITIPLKFAGAELFSKTAEGLLARMLQKCPKGIGEFFALVFIHFSPVTVFLMVKYGVFESMWAGFLAFVSRLV
jgi:hypothetical protein